MWVLVLKGLKQAIEAHTARAYLGLSTVKRPFYRYGGHIELIRFNPFAPGDFAEKGVLKLVEWFSGHCRAIKS